MTCTTRHCEFRPNGDHEKSPLRTHRTQVPSLFITLQPIYDGLKVLVLQPSKKAGKTRRDAFEGYNFS